MEVLPLLLLNLFIVYFSIGLGIVLAFLVCGDAHEDMQSLRDNNDELAIMLDGMSGLLGYSFIYVIYLIIWTALFTIAWPYKARKLIK